MNKTMSFVRLDFYALKPYKRSLALLILIGLGMGVALRSMAVLSSIFMVGQVLVMAYPFAIGEKNGTDTLYATLSLRRRSVVRGRYAFAVLVELIGILVILFSAAAYSALFAVDMVMQELFASICLLSFIVSLTVALQYPLYFKLGYTKAKVFTYIPLMLLSVAIGVLPSLAKEMPNIDYNALLELVSRNPLLLYAVPVLSGWALLAVSCAISCGVYGKRDL